MPRPPLGNACDGWTGTVSVCAYVTLCTENSSVRYNIGAFILDVLFSRFYSLLSLIFNIWTKHKEKWMVLFGLPSVPKGHVNNAWILSHGSKVDIGVWFIFWKHIIFCRAQDPCYSGFECVSTRLEIIIFLEIKAWFWWEVWGIIFFRLLIRFLSGSLQESSSTI